MARPAPLAILLLILLGPTAPLLGTALLATPACHPQLVPAAQTTATLTVAIADGQQITLGPTRLTHARTIIATGLASTGVTAADLLVAVTAALTESGLRMLANTTAHPTSADFPNDGNGSDHDSLGLFQMRPQAGWGSVEELMDPAYQARAFFGGPTGPNGGDPPGLLDIPDRHTLTTGAAAQAVERSAHPHRYDQHVPAARQILHTLTGSDGSTPTGCTADGLPGPPDPLTESAIGRVPDPTGTGGFVTPITAHLIAETRRVFPDSGWTCWAARPGTASEHPLGRACDVTFGNPIGAFPTADQVAAGWQMTLWLQQHADALAVQYLIWQGHIWSTARHDEDWRPYRGGGIHDPTHPTGGHYDHLHITTIAR